MTNNDVLRRLSFALSLTDEELVRVFSLGGVALRAEQAAALTLRENKEGVVPCSDVKLLAFLDGLILDRRGPREPGAPAAPSVELSNNLILKKVRIALSLQEEDMLGMLREGGESLTPWELTALFRKPGHKNYRPCTDKVLNRFLSGLTARLRPEA